MLRQNGYNTAWFGKNHNVPDWQNSQAGPFDLWPTGLGFEYFYGFIGGDTSQWAPALFEDIKPIEPPHDDQDYFFDHDMADHAIDRIRMLHAVAPDKPWLTYYAPGTAHAPHHAPKEWIAKFKGQFDQGWDKVREETLARQKTLGIVPPDTQLTDASEGIPAWDSLDADHKKVYAHMMEVYAAALTLLRHTDRPRPRRDCTRWASSTTRWSSTSRATTAPAPRAARRACSTRWRSSTAFPKTSAKSCADMDELGGPTTFNHYPIGWAHAMDTPFQWTKQIASHFGGTRNGMVISWPARIKDKGGMRPQFHHVIDIAPTILEAVGVPSAGGAQRRAAEAHRRRQHGLHVRRCRRRPRRVARSISRCSPTAPSTTTAGSPPRRRRCRRGRSGKTIAVDDYKWELYDLTKDFSQANNLAAKEPKKLRELQELFWIEAAKYNVLPLDNSKLERMNVDNRPSLTRGRALFTYYPGMIAHPRRQRAEHLEQVVQGRRRA